MAMTDFDEFLEKQLESPEFRKEWVALEPAYAIIKAMIDARNTNALTSKELSERSGISQSYITQLENGNANPSVKTLQRLADAMGKTLKIEFV